MDVLVYRILPGCWQQTWCDASPSNEPKTALFYQAFHGIPTAQVAVSAWQTRQRREGVRTKKDAVGCCCATSTRSRFEMLGMKVLWDLWGKAATDKIIPARDPKQREFNVSVDTELSITHITCWKYVSFHFFAVPLLVGLSTFAPALHAGSLYAISIGHCNCAINLQPGLFELVRPQIVWPHSTVMTTRKE